MNSNQQRSYVINTINLIDTLKKEQNIDTGGKVPHGLMTLNERKHMTNRQILEKIYKFGQYMSDKKEKSRKLWICCINIREHLV